MAFFGGGHTHKPLKGLLVTPVKDPPHIWEPNQWGGQGGAVPAALKIGGLGIFYLLGQQKILGGCQEKSPPPAQAYSRRGGPRLSAGVAAVAGGGAGAM